MSDFVQGRISDKVWGQFHDLMTLIRAGKYCQREQGRFSKQVRRGELEGNDVDPSRRIASKMYDQSQAYYGQAMKLMDEMVTASDAGADTPDYTLILKIYTIYKTLDFDRYDVIGFDGEAGVLSVLYEDRPKTY